jgi:indole-3-acetate monooxygenase
VVSGRWPYASGCQHSDWVFTVCKVFDGDQMRMTAGGRPELSAVCVPTTELTIEETWDVSGLAGTGSHDVVIKAVFVPAEHTFYFGPGMVPRGRHFLGPLYRYPVYASAIAPIGALALGIAQGAIDAGIEFAQSKYVGPTELLREKPMLQIRLAEAVALVRAARAWLYNGVQQTWETQLAGGQITFDERADLLLSAANATRSAAAAVDIVYTAAGPTANHRRSPLQRALRDIHALTQHIATAPLQYESAGRMLLGLEPLQWAMILW